MAWMDESFKRDKRFLELQLKRGKMKIQEVNALLTTLPDVSSKAEPMNPEEPEHQEAPRENETSGATEEKG